MGNEAEQVVAVIAVGITFGLACWLAIVALSALTDRILSYITEKEVNSP